MAGNNEVIGIEVQVKLEQLRAQLATLGPGMEKEAKAMTAALNREIKQQTAAMKAASKATSQVRTDSIKEVAEASEAAGTKLDKLAKAAGPLGGVLSRISPEAGALASSLAGLTGAAEGVAAGLGTSMSGGVAAMSAVIGPAVVALALLAANMQYEAAQAEASEAAHQALNEAIKYTQELASGTADAMLDLKVKVGQLAPEEAAFEKALKGVTAEYEKQDAAIEQAIEARKAAGGAWGAEVKALRDSQEESKRLRDERVLLLAADKEWAAEVRKSAEFVAERDKAAEAAAKAAAERATAAAAALAEQDAATARATERDLDRMEAMDEHRRKYAAKAKKLAEEQRTIDEKNAEVAMKQAEELAKAEIKAREDVQSASLSIMGSTTDGLMLLSEKLGETNKEAGLAAFGVAKALAISTALVNTALGVTNALATGGAAAPALAIAAGAAGAVEVATIAATEPPSFASGGLIDGASTMGSPAIVHPQEAVLNQQGRKAIGDDAIRAANAGAMQGGGQTISIVYKHRAFDYFVADNLRTGGPLSAAVRRGDRVGQLRRGRG